MKAIEKSCITQFVAGVFEYADASPEMVCEIENILARAFELAEWECGYQALQGENALESNPEFCGDKVFQYNYDRLHDLLNK